MANTTAQDGKAMVERAARMRKQLIEETTSANARLAGEGRDGQQRIAAAEASVKEATTQIELRKAGLEARSDRAAEHRRNALEAEQRGNQLLAQEELEKAQVEQAIHDEGQRDVTRMEQARADTAKQIEVERAHVADVVRQKDAITARRDKAEEELDKLEDKGRYLQESDEHAANATRLRAEADQARAAGRDEEADRLVAEATEESIAASAKQGSSDEIAVDESTLPGADPGGLADAGGADSGDGAVAQAGAAEGLAGASSLLGDRAAGDGGLADPFGDADSLVSAAGAGAADGVPDSGTTSQTGRALEDPFPAAPDGGDTAPAPADPAPGGGDQIPREVEDPLGNDVLFPTVPTPNDGTLDGDPNDVTDRDPSTLEIPPTDSFPTEAPSAEAPEVEEPSFEAPEFEEPSFEEPSFDQGDTGGDFTDQPAEPEPSSDDAAGGDPGFES